MLMIFKKSPATFLFLSLILLAPACRQNTDEEHRDAGRQENAEAPRPIRLTGRLKNSDDSVKTLYFRPFNSYKRFELRLDSSGRFSEELEVPRPLYLTFFRSLLFVKPGDSIHLEGDIQHLDSTLSFSGDRRAINEYLLEIDRLKDSLSELKKKIYLRSPSAFIHGIDSIQGLYTNRLKAKELPSELEEMEKERMRWKKAYNRLRYKGFHAYYAEKDKDSLEMPEGFYRSLNELEPDPSTALSMPSFYRFLDKYAYHLAKRNQGSDSSASAPPLIEQKQAAIEERFESDTVHIAFLAKMLFDQLQREGIDHTDPLLTRLEESPLYPELADSLRARYKEWKPIAEGKEAPGFAYPNLEGDTVSLEDLQGNYVYIDAWATWCGPCRQEIPHLKELEERFANEKVSFVSVSLDKKGVKERWKKMVQEKDMGGHQLFANGEAFDSKLAKDYLIRSIPRFILIGPDGRIIDNNAERPSGDAEEQLEKLLKEEEKHESAA